MNNLTRIALTVTLLFISNSYAQTELARDIYFAPSDPGVVKIMTFNIRACNIMDGGSWPSRKPLVFEVISFHAPDIFGLQEPLHRQLQEVQQAFPQYASYWAGGADGEERGEGCPIFFRKDRFTLLDSGTFWFSNRPDEPGAKGWGNLVPRFCSWVELSEKGRDTSFYVYNTHLDSLSQKSREKSVRLLAGQIAARKNSSPFIIMGDFNMRLINPAMTFLLESSPENQFPVVDAWLSVHPHDPDASTSPCGLQIDHIQLGLNARPLEAEIDSRKIDGRYPSDHFPVIAKIMLPAAPVVSKAPRAPRAHSAPY